MFTFSRRKAPLTCFPTSCMTWGVSNSWKSIRNITGRSPALATTKCWRAAPSFKTTICRTARRLEKSRRTIWPRTPPKIKATCIKKEKEPRFLFFTSLLTFGFFYFFLPHGIVTQKGVRRICFHFLSQPDFVLPVQQSGIRPVSNVLEKRIQNELVPGVRGV